ncbi:DUF7133 domain-containing protein, partial [Streptococcus pneumoniae]|uniref:DUF7133 domain-containing protein n=1 Tax=Streptococcus pneumoniae TaxID=1313 RepID=UPI003CC7ACD5
MGPLVTSKSSAFRPTDCRVGPDGAIYLCDWHNPVIGHYQASYRDPARDKIHGRIWRVSQKNAPAMPVASLPKFDSKNLPKQLE